MSDETEELRLDLLPTELILRISFFLDARFVVRSLSIVCKRLHAILNNASFWKARMFQRWPRKYPALPVLDIEFNWVAACMEREEQHRRWSNVSAEMDYYCYSQSIDSSVDGVHVFQNGRFVAAGTRGRCLTILDLHKLVPGDSSSINSCCIFNKVNAHQGWIWPISSYDNILSTGSWDTHIKFWDLASLDVVSDVKLNSAVLCMHHEPNSFIAGGFDGNIYHIDPRQASVIDKRRYHARSVLSVVVNEQHIVSASDDKTLCVFDRRGNKVATKLELEQSPLSLSGFNNQLWVGSRTGEVLLIDASDSDFTVVEKYDIGHTRQVTGIIATLGAIFTCSMDKTIKVLDPSVSPSVIATLSEHNGELSKISYQDGVLACAPSDSYVGIYRPKLHAR